MASSLNITDSLGDVEIILAIEQAFGIDLDAEPEGSINNCVGDLYDVLVRRMPSDSGPKCASAMAFYRLRRAIRDLRRNERIGPGFAIEDITSMPPRRALPLVAEATGLELPSHLCGDCKTLGELAEKAAVINFRKLVDAGASSRAETIWNTLIEILTWQEGVELRKEEIARDTTFW